LNIPHFVQNPQLKSIYVTSNNVSEAFVGCKKFPVVQRCFLKQNVNDQGGVEIDTQIVQSNAKDIFTDVIEIGIITGENMEYVQCEDGVTFCGFNVV
jgi:hypothetical protein